jgi:hypothetical protein
MFSASKQHAVRGSNPPPPGLEPGIPPLSNFRRVSAVIDDQSLTNPGLSQDLSPIDSHA